MDAVGFSLIGTFVLMMFASVYGLSAHTPPKREKKHANVSSSVIG
jgi:hypothetical protein